MSKILVYGCGDLAWARKSDSPFGAQWDTGRLTDRWNLPQAEAPERIAVSLTAELDRLAGWTTSREPAKPKVEIRRGRAIDHAPLPAWSTLASAQVRWATEQLQGSGVLVTPEPWRHSHLGREFLRAWAEAGWTWAPLEEVARLKFTEGVRFVSAGRSWIRICEPRGSAVVANGAEAACAVEVASAILDAALAAVGGDLAARWRAEEEPASGWFSRQQIVRRATEAMQGGRQNLELGRPYAPLFLFSSDQARKRYRELAKLRLTVDLPQLSVASWWQQIATPDFLQAPPGVSRRPLMQWGDLETILVDHPHAGGPANRSETQLLFRHLRFNGLPHRRIDPATLTEAPEIEGELGRWLAHWQRDDEAEQHAAAEAAARAAAADDEDLPASDSRAEQAGTAAAAVVEEAVVEPFYEEVVDEPPAEPMPAFDPLLSPHPEYVFIGEPHRPDNLRIWIDGRRIRQEDVRQVELGRDSSGYQSGYQIEGEAVSFGTVVRIDFEPEEPEVPDEPEFYEN